MSELDRPSTAVTVAGFVAFLILGLVVASYGPSIPHLAVRFGVTDSVAGLIVASSFLGECVGILALGLTHARWSLGSRCSIGALLAGIGILAAAAAPTWLLLLLGVFVFGIGAGGLVGLLNLYFATRFGRRSPAMVSLANTAYGVGSFLGPALVAIAQGYAQIYLAVGIGILLCVGFLRQATEEVATPALVPAGMNRRSVTLIIAFAAMLFVYVAIEVGVGTWETTDLVDLGQSAGFAAGATSAYWAAFTIGRLLTAPLAVRYSPQRLLVPSLVLVIALLIAVFAHVAPPVMFALVGLCTAPIFPVTVSWMTRAVPNASSAAIYPILGAIIGAALLPAALGGLIAVAGIDAFPLGVAACALACLGMVGLISLRLRT